ncbi:MAG: hypothetical protein K2X69_04390 [Silvanigrellaceae bacterium]|nr:hypothetical protein [Silvanigrellaceae bacterium]
MIKLLLLLLAVLNLIEATTNISRRIGYSINNPAAGLFFQNSLSIISRMVMFLFLPILSYLSDKNLVFIRKDIGLIFLTPVFIYLLYKYRLYVENFFAVLILRIDINGSFFKKSNIKFKYLKSIKKSILPLKFKILILILNVPFYLSWIIVFILLENISTYRATIISSTTFFNGLFILGTNFFVDPFLSKLGKYKNIILIAYDEIILLKFYSSFFACSIAFLIYVIYF